jgi:hypothetical protein
VASRNCEVEFQVLIEVLRKSAIRNFVGGGNFFFGPNRLAVLSGIEQIEKNQRKNSMDALRRADADVATATHPGRNLRWRLNR